MTIAAGFNFDSGVLLCADTKMTGPGTLFESKLFPKWYDSGARSIFAISGNISFAKMAVRKCERAIDKMANPSLNKMEDDIESTILRVHKQHVYPHPDRGILGIGPEFSLLIALWSPVDGLRTYFTNQSSIDTFDVYRCVGSGEYLGDYIIKPRYEFSTHDIKRAVSVACAALTAIKSYDPNCGGNSQFMSLSKAGQFTEMRSYDISHIEEFSESFYSDAEKLYSELADLSLGKEEVEASFVDFKASVVHSRVHHKRSWENTKALWEAMFNWKEEPDVTP